MYESEEFVEETVEIPGESDRPLLLLKHEIDVTSILSTLVRDEIESQCERLFKLKHQSICRFFPRNKVSASSASSLAPSWVIVDSSGDKSESIGSELSASVASLSESLDDKGVFYSKSGEDEGFGLNYASYLVEIFKCSDDVLTLKQFVDRFANNPGFRKLRVRVFMQLIEALKALHDSHLLGLYLPEDALSRIFVLRDFSVKDDMSFKIKVQNLGPSFVKVSRNSVNTFSPDSSPLTEFLAPESFAEGGASTEFKSESNAESRAVWSAGVLYYWMAFGRSPWVDRKSKAPNAFQRSTRISKANWMKVEESDKANWTEEDNELLNRMLFLDSSRRITIDELMETLKSWEGEEDLVEIESSALSHLEKIRIFRLNGKKEKLAYVHEVNISELGVPIEEATKIVSKLKDFKDPRICQILELPIQGRKEGSHIQEIFALEHFGDCETLAQFYDRTDKMHDDEFKMRLSTFAQLLNIIGSFKDKKLLETLLVSDILSRTFLIGGSLKLQAYAPHFVHYAREHPTVKPEDSTFTSPEQITKEGLSKLSPGEIKEKSLIWALGVVFFRIVIGRSPWNTSSTSLERLMKIVKVDYGKIEDDLLRPDIRAEIKETIQGSLCKPEDRISLEDFVENVIAIQQILSEAESPRRESRVSKTKASSTPKKSLPALPMTAERKSSERTLVEGENVDVHLEGKDDVLPDEVKMLEPKTVLNPKNDSKEGEDSMKEDSKEKVVFAESNIEVQTAISKKVAPEVLPPEIVPATLTAAAVTSVEFKEPKDQGFEAIQDLKKDKKMESKISTGINPTAGVQVQEKKHEMNHQLFAMLGLATFIAFGLGYALGYSRCM